jgi:hypothetical protein
VSLRKKISQREAQRLRKRVRELEQRLANIDTRWPGGVQVCEITLLEVTHARLMTAREFAGTLLLRHHREREWAVMATNVDQVRP